MTEVSKLRSDIRDAIDANMIGGSDEHPTISTDGLVGDLVELFHSPPRSPTGEAMSETKEVAGLVEQLDKLGEWIDFDFGSDDKSMGDIARGGAREIERLQSDLTRYIDIATKEATEAEGLRAERDAALAAEDAAKDCFWAIYPDWAEMKGHGLTTEAAKSMLAERVSTLTRQLEEAREGNNTLTFLLDEALPYLETVTDEGPFDERWRSQDLQNLIAAIRSLKQGERE